MKALVTGGGGFLGRYIAEMLNERGDQVTVFARGHYPDLAQMGIDLIQGDVADAEAVKVACTGMDAVFHVAAFAWYWGPWEKFYRTNVIGTQNIIDACRSQKVPKLIYTSTPSVVFANHSHEGANESLPYPQKYEANYPKSKAMAEQLVIAANDDTLSTCCLRPHLIFGPRDNNLIVPLAEKAISGQLIQVGDGKNRVDFCFVEDAARAHLQAADALKPGSAVAGSVYFITQDEPVFLWKWLNTVFSVIGAPTVKKRLPLKLVRTVAAILETIHRLMPFLGDPRITRFLASEMAASHHYDISKAKRDFGYQPQHTMAQALEKTIPFLRDHFKR